MRGLLAGLWLAAAKKGGSDACPDAYLWKGTGVVPLCEAHFPDDKAKNGWIVYFQGEDNWAQKLVQDSRPLFIEAAKAGKKDPALAGLKFGAASCYGASQPFCAKRGGRKYPAVVYTDGKTIESFPATPEELRTLDPDALLAFARKASVGSAGKASADCDQGVFAKDSEDATLPLCAANFPAQGAWVVAFYDKGSAHEDKKLRVTLNKAAKKFGNVARAKQAKKNVAVKVGAVKCASSEELCTSKGVEAPVGEPVIHLYHNGEKVAESGLGEFTDGEELRDWAKAQLPEDALKAPEKDAEPASAKEQPAKEKPAKEAKPAKTPEPAAADAGEDRAALEAELAKAKAEKAAAVEAEDFKKAKQLKGAIEKLEKQLASAAPAASKAELEEELAKAKAEKAAAVEAEDFKKAKQLKARVAELEKQLGRAEL